MRAHNRFRLAATLLAVLVFAGVGFAQQGYKKPPKEVLDILNAPVTPGASVSPTRDKVILATGLRYPPLADLAQPMLRLAGERINPAANSPPRADPPNPSWRPAGEQINPAANSPHRFQYSVALTLKRIADGSEVEIDI